MGKNKKATTISRKLTLQVSSMITALLVIIMLLGLTMVYKMVDDSSKDKLKLEAQAYQYEIEGWIGSILKQANAVYASVKKHGMINDKEEMLEYLKEVTLDLDKAMPLGMYVVKMVAIMIQQDGKRQQMNLISSKNVVGLKMESIVRR